MTITLTASAIDVSAITRTLNANKVRIQTSAVKAVEGVMKRRIFNLGRKTDGSAIGDYKEYRAYFSLSDYVRKSAFNPKEGRKTVRFDNGWKGLREANGRQGEYVDLDYSSSLRAGLIVGTSGNNVVLGFSDKGEIDKANGNEKRYGVIFAHSEKEKEVGLQAAQLAMNEVLREYGLTVV